MSETQRILDAFDALAASIDKGEIAASSDAIRGVVQIERLIARQTQPERDLTEREEIDAIWGALEDLDDRLIALVGDGRKEPRKLRTRAREL